MSFRVQTTAVALRSRAQAAGRLAQRTPWKDVAEAQGLQSIHQRDVQVAKQAPVLKAIVQENQLAVLFVDRLLGRAHTVCVQQVRQLREFLPQLERLVVDF